jgi:hypothetical protein
MSIQEGCLQRVWPAHVTLADEPSAVKSRSHVPRKHPDRSGRDDSPFRKTAGQGVCHQLPGTCSDL